MNPLAHIVGTVLFALAPPSGDKQTREVVVESSGPSAQGELDARHPGFATAIDLDTEVGARPSAALPELLARSPGVSVRSIGGLGQFSSVSLRGSSAQQVQIFWDGAPIGGSLAGLVDLSTIPLDGLSRVEIYRGYVPIAFGAATVGGAIDLVGAVNRGFPSVSAAGGLGSFGAHEARVDSSVPLTPRASLTTRLALAGARGDFPYFDDAGTPTTTADDGWSRRRNNDYRRVFGQLRAEGERARWRWSAQELFTWKDQGIPGTAAQQSSASSLDTLDARTIAKLVRVGLGSPGGSLEWITAVGTQRYLYGDPLGEIGLAVDDQRLLAVDTYLSPRLRLRLWRGAHLGLVAHQRSEWIHVDERATGAVAGAVTGDARRRRQAWGVGAQLEQELFARRLLVVPAIHFDALESRFAVAVGAGELDDQGRDQLTVAASPRLGTRLRLIDGVDVRASAGRYFRPPTLLELFGDRGYVLGNEGLVAEHGDVVDGGVVVDLEDLGGRDRLDLYAQVAGFATFTRDLIQWVQSGPVVRPVNFEGATIAGVEAGLSLSAWARALVTSANYTFTDTANHSVVSGRRGRALPGRPAHEVFARVSTGTELRHTDTTIEPRVFYTLDFVAGAFLDPSERVAVGPRVLHGVGAELHLRRRLHLAFEIRNLLDSRVTTWDPPVDGVGALTMPASDYIGYPLPGRSVWGSVGLDLELPRPRPRRARRASASGSSRPP